jgi:transposase InsO family protein
MKPEERRALIAKMTVSSRKQRGALLREYGIPRSTYAEWVKKEQARGQEGLVGHELGYVWNRIRPSEELQVVQYAKDHPEQYARELSVGITEQLQIYVSEATVYRILKRHNLLFPRATDRTPAEKEWRHKTTRPDEVWQMDATVFFIVGYGYYKAIPVLDDYSRYVLSAELFPDETSPSAAMAVELAMERARELGHDLATKPTILSDNGSGFKGEVFAQYLAQHGVRHIFGAPYHPQTQGKVERFNRTLKERTSYVIVYTSPEELRQALKTAIEEYNIRPHTAHKNVCPKDVYLGMKDAVLKRREEIKKLTMERRKMYNRQKAQLEGRI